MNKLFLLSVLFCSVSHFAFSQNKNYEKGYFINNNNNKVECLIKNEDWDYNPTEFKYKADENANPNVMSVNNIQEFTVGEEYKFKNVNVKIDKSSDTYENASGLKVLNLVDDILLLRVRVEGKAVLYSYQNENYTRFFYSIDQGPITQLSYKLYYDDKEKNYRKNENYKQELLNNLKCDKITLKDIENLEYKDSKLVDLFVKYNNCTGGTKNNFESKKIINTFEVYAKLGAGLSSFSFDDGSNAHFDKKVRFKVAIEAELNLSNKWKKWSALLEPSYASYSNSYTYNSTSRLNVEYKAIDISFGLRRYFELNAKSLVYTNAYVTLGFQKGSKFDFTNSTSDNVVLSNTINPSLGFGYLYDKKYSLELRYEFSRDLFNESSYVKSAFSTVGLLVGYKFL